MKYNKDVINKKNQILNNLKIQLNNQQQMNNSNNIQQQPKYEPEQEPERNTIQQFHTAKEKRQNTNYINNDFMEKILNIFDNDPEDSEYFYENFDKRKLSHFNTIYNQLIKLFKGRVPNPDNVIRTANNLIDNLVNTGNYNAPPPQKSSGANKQLLNQILNINNYISEQIDNSNLNQRGGDDLKNVLNQIFTYEKDYDKFNNVEKSRYNEAKKQINPYMEQLIAILLSNVDEQIKLKRTIDVLIAVKKILSDISQQDFSPQELKEQKENILKRKKERIQQEKELIKQDEEERLKEIEDKRQREKIEEETINIKINELEKKLNESIRLGQQSKTSLKKLNALMEAKMELFNYLITNNKITKATKNKMLKEIQVYENAQSNRINNK